MTMSDRSASAPGRRRWGEGRALFDDNEAAVLLLSAAERCIVRRGTARVAMAEVAEEAGVTRSTLYRYFPNRTELITALLLARAEALVAGAVASLPDPDDAAASLTCLILYPLETVAGTPVTDALFSPRSEGLVTFVEFESDALFDLAHRHFGPVLARWQAAGQLHADLDISTTVRWLIAQAVLLVSSPWRAVSPEDRRTLIDRYVARALLTR
jgi:TetR/AcrR family transcriptional regulator